MEIKTYTLRLFKNDKRKNYAVNFFVTLVADNGHQLHLVNEEIVDKESGNELFRKLIADGDYKKEVKTTEAKDEEIIQYLMRNYDEYWMMSDDPRVYRDAPKTNKRILEKVNIFKEIASWPMSNK
jgi:hypothetical protein